MARGLLLQRRRDKQARDRTRELGRVVNVKEEVRGSVLSQGESSSATTLHVDDTTDFDERGGQLKLNGVVYSYTAIDDAALTITLASGITAAAADEDRVDIDPRAVRRWAAVLINGATDESDITWARVRHALMDKLVLGAREPGKGEWVSLRHGANGWVVDDLPGQEPEYDPEIVQQIIDITVQGGGADEPLGRAAEENAPGGANDEEFTSGLGGLSIEVQRGGDTNSWAVGHNRALYVHSDTPGANGDMHAILNDVALSTGDYIECAVEFCVDKVYFGPALVISDGTTFGSGKQAVVWVFSPGTTWTTRIENRSNFSSTAATGGDFDYSIPRLVYLRLKYESANTFRGYYSADGKTWQDVGSLTITMTPTHIGIAAYHFSASSPVSGWLQFHYFRVNPAND